MINIFLFSFFSSIYLFCSGLLFFSNKKQEFEEIYITIIFGAILLSLLAVFLNFFLPLSIKLNTFIYILISIYGFFKILKNENLTKLIYCSILISLISTLIIYFDNIYRPDANLYHLPYTKIVNENKMIIGISNIHFRFGHVSIIQYLNAIFNNYLFKDYGVIMPAAIIFSSIVLYFWKEINKNIIKNKIYCYYIFLLLSYILYGYNRYSEFGNDTIAHLYFFFLSSYFLKEKFINDIDDKEFFKISILSLYCFMLKTSLVFALLFPFYFFIKNFKKSFLFNYSNIFIFLIILMWFSKNIFVSGCLVYPIQITCFENLQWFSNDLNENISAENQSLDNEAWTKGWPDYKGPEITQEFYVKKFFWVKTWLSVHGLFIFEKMSIFITILFVINLLIKKIELKNNFIKKKLDKRIIVLIFFSLFCSIIWFLRYPVFRYGSSYLAVLTVATFTFWAIKSNLYFKNDKKFEKFIRFSIVFFFILFVVKHSIRIYKNFDYELTDDPWPVFPKAVNTENISEEKKIGDNFKYYLLKPNRDGCGYTLSPCTPYPLKNVKYKKVNGYTILYLRQ